jgi:hypothetical protein
MTGGPFDHGKGHYCRSSPSLDGSLKAVFSQRFGLKSAASWQTAPIDILDWNRIKIDIFKATDVDSPIVWRSAWPLEGQNATILAKIIPGDVGVE